MLSFRGSGDPTVLLTLVIGVAVAALFRAWRAFSSEATIFLLCGLLASLVLLAANDLLLIYLALELQGLVTVTLAVGSKSTGSYEASIKYLFLSAATGSIFL